MSFSSPSLLSKQLLIWHVIMLPTTVQLKHLFIRFVCWGLSSNVLQKVLNYQARLFLTAANSDTNRSREAFCNNQFYYITYSLCLALSLTFSHMRSLTFFYPSLILFLMHTSYSVKLIKGLLVQPEYPKLYLSHSSLTMDFICRLIPDVFWSYLLQKSTFVFTFAVHPT